MVSIAKADVFISHSHKDIEKVKAFAGWLKEKIWSYSVYRFLCLGLLR